MITRNEYLKALKVIEQYKFENQIGEVAVGDMFKYRQHPKGGKTRPNLTIGNIYEVLKVRRNYLYKQLAVAIRDDGGHLRWYSFDSMSRYCDKV